MEQGEKAGTPLDWATSALPQSHDSQTTTNPHNPLYYCTSGIYWISLISRLCAFVACSTKFAQRVRVLYCKQQTRRAWERGYHRVVLNASDKSYLTEYLYNSIQFQSLGKLPHGRLCWGHFVHIQSQNTRPRYYTICDISRYMGYGISCIGHMTGEPAGKLM